MCRIKYFFIPGLWICASLVFAQNPDNRQSAGQNTERRENLFFQGITGNNLVFYNDRNGLFYLKFRIDKWDYDNNDRVRELIKGNKYSVTFQFTKETENPEELKKEVKTSANKTEDQIAGKNIRKPGFVIIGVYKNHVSNPGNLRGIEK